MRFLGAKVVLTPAAERGIGMVGKAQELAKTHGWFMTRQFENEANPDMHERTTAREIIADFAGERLDYWVTGFGTGGTLNGVSRVLRKEAPRHQDHRLRAERRADAHIGERSRNAMPTARRQSPIPRSSRIRCRAGARTSFRASPAKRSTRRLIDRILTIPGPEAMKCARSSGAAGRHLRRHHRPARPLPARCRSQRSCAEARPCCACCPIPASAICRRRCSPTSGADMSDDELKVSNSTPNHRLPPKTA